MDSIMHILDLIGTAVFSITGALVAGRNRMDTFGVVILGCVTAVGGGTLRDVVLGRNPVFWVSSPHYLTIAALAAIGTFVVAHRWRLPEMAIAYADAVGLAVFTVIGFQTSFQTTGSFGISIIMGMTTGVVGGIIRDVLAGEIPLIFHKEIYASASLAGAALLALFHPPSVARESRHPTLHPDLAGHPACGPALESDPTGLPSKKPETITYTAPPIFHTWASMKSEYFNKPL